MTTKPQLTTEGSLTAGLAAIALFLLFAGVFLTASFPNPVGFGQNPAITTSLGAAMFDIAPGILMGEGETAVPGEGFLLAFETVDAVLVAALVGAIMLARREEKGENVTLNATDTEEPPVAADGGSAGEEGGEE